MALAVQIPPLLVGERAGGEVLPTRRHHAIGVRLGECGIEGQRAVEAAQRLLVAAEGVERRDT